MLNTLLLSKKGLLRTLLLLSSVLLTNCTNNNQPKLAGSVVNHDNPIWLNHLKQLSQIQSYEAHGILGYKQSNKGSSSQFVWYYQDENNYQLHLFSSISPSSLTITMTPQGVIVNDNKGNQRRAVNPELLLAEVVGISFPIELFGQWLKGNPIEAKDYTVVEPYLLQQLTYQTANNHWTVNYDEYERSLSPLLPKQITVFNQKQQLKISIRQWKW